MASVQVAPFWHGLEAHSLILIWQRVPDQPLMQEQEKLFTASMQIPALEHGVEAHSLMLD
jgi:hypothetical protein